MSNLNDQINVIYNDKKFVDLKAQYKKANKEKNTDEVNRI